MCPTVNGYRNEAVSISTPKPVTFFFPDLDMKKEVNKRQVEKRRIARCDFGRGCQHKDTWRRHTAPSSHTCSQVLWGRRWDSSNIYFYFMCITSVAGLLARSQYPVGPATGHIGTGFSWFPCVYKRMLRWFPRLPVATACFSCSPPDLNLLDPYIIFMYTHYNHCHRVTAYLQLNILLLLLLLLLLCVRMW
jgi:hypothetical protein